RDDERAAGTKRDRIAIRDETITAPGEHDAGPDRRVRVRRLPRARGKVEMVQTGVALAHRRDQQAVAASVDVPQAAGRLDRSAEDVHADVSKRGGDHAGARSGNARRPDDREVIA